MPRAKSEIEIKLAVASAADARKRIRAAGFQIHLKRHFESNVIWDTADLRFRQEGKLVRLRDAGGRSVLTFKGKSADGRHKVREEIESSIDRPFAIERVLREVGFSPVFRYEKYRTEFTQEHGGVVMLDETPIGTFLEIEGSPRWIDRTAKRLGFSQDDYITLSYGALYMRHCASRGVKASNMVFH